MVRCSSSHQDEFQYLNNRRDSKQPPRGEWVERKYRYQLIRWLRSNKKARCKHSVVSCMFSPVHIFCLGQQLAVQLTVGISLHPIAVLTSWCSCYCCCLTWYCHVVSVASCCYCSAAAVAAVATADVEYTASRYKWRCYCVIAEQLPWLLQNRTVLVLFSLEQATVIRSSLIRYQFTDSKQITKRYSVWTHCAACDWLNAVLFDNVLLRLKQSYCLHRIEYLR